MRKHLMIALGLRRFLFAFVAFSLTFLVSVQTLAQTDANGFFTDYLTAIGYNARGSSINTAEQESDSLCDGEVSEDTIIPEEGLELLPPVIDPADCEGSRTAALQGFHPSALLNADENLPIAIHTVGNTTLDFRGIIRAADPAGNNANTGNIMAYSWVYVENVTGAPLHLTMGIGSDDSHEVRVNRERVFLRTSGRGSGGNGTVQDRFPVTLNPGGNLVQFKTWQGGGGWNMRARLEMGGVCPANSRSGANAVLSGDGLIEVGTSFIDFEPRAVRSIDSSGLAPDPVTANVVVTVENGGASYDYEENFDAGWTSSNVSPAATEAGDGFLRWTGITAAEISYTLTRMDEWFDSDGVVSGSITIGGTLGGVGGDQQIAGGVQLASFAPAVLVTAAMMNPHGANTPRENIDGDWITGVDGDGNDVSDATIVPVEGMELFPEWNGASQSQGLSAISIDAQDRFWTAPGDPNDGMILVRLTTGDGYLDWQAADIYGPVDQTMNIAYFYAINPTDQAMVVYGSIGTDDSAGVRVNGLPVFSNSVARGNPGFADQFRLQLDPGKNLIAYSAFEGGGGYNARFRFEDASGNPVDVPTTVSPAGYDPDAHEDSDLPRTYILHASEILFTAAFDLDYSLYTGTTIPGANISGDWIAGVDGDGNEVTDSTIVPFQGMQLFPDFGGASQALGLTEIGGKDEYWTDPQNRQESGTNLVRETDSDARYNFQAGGIFTGTPDPNHTTAIGWFYVVNQSAEPICATVALRSDDSAGVRVNGRIVFTVTVSHGLANYDTADRFPARFDPGKNLVAVQAFDHEGGFGVAARLEYESSDDDPPLVLTLDPIDYDPDPAAHPEPGPDCQLAGAGAITYLRTGAGTGLVTEFLVGELPFEIVGGGGTIGGAVPEDYVSQEDEAPDLDTIFEGALIEPGTSGQITTGVRGTDCGLTRLVKFNGFVNGTEADDRGDFDGNIFYASVGNTNYSASIFFHVINKTNSDLDAWFGFASDDGATLFLNGELVIERIPGRGRGGDNVLQDLATEAATLTPGDNLVQLSYKQGGGGSGIRVGLFPDDCFGDAFGPEIEVTVNPPGVDAGGLDEVNVTRSLSPLDGCTDNASATLTFSVPGGGSADVDLLEALPSGASGSNASLGSFSPDGSELTLQGMISDGMTITYDVSGASAEKYGCSTVNGLPVLGDNSFQDLCPTRCLELHESGGVREMLIIGPIDAGGNTGGNCDDNGNLETTDYLTNADGSISEEDLEVLLGDEIEPDFGGAAGGVGVKTAANGRINPRRAEGILTVWRADANSDGYINFNDADNIGNPVDDYIVYSLTFLENTTDDFLDVELEVGSDDAVKVVVNGELLHVNSVCRGIPGAGGGDRLPVMLEPGRNSVLIAVVERGGGTGVRLIVRDELGLPFIDGEVRTCRSPEIEPTGSSVKPGDINGDGGFNISDPVAHLNFLFTGGPLPACYVVPDADPVDLTAAGQAILDFNGDGSSNIADAVGELSFLFSGAGSPPHVLGEDCVVLAAACTSNCQ